MSNQTQAHLIGIHGALAGQRIALDRDEIIVGRQADCTVMLQDPQVSRRHLIIRRLGDAYQVHDAGSSSGTWLNGQRITQAFLNHGDEISLGATMLRFEGGVSALPAAFRDLQMKFSALRAQFQAGQLGEQAYREALQALIVQDGTGTHWMLGAESGAWYRYGEGKWVAGDPAQAPWNQQADRAASSPAAGALPSQMHAGRLAVAALALLLALAACVGGVGAFLRTSEIMGFFP